MGVAVLGVFFFAFLGAWCIGCKWLGIMEQPKIYRSSIGPQKKKNRKGDEMTEAEFQKKLSEKCNEIG